MQQTDARANKQDFHLQYLQYTTQNIKNTDKIQKNTDLQIYLTFL